MWHVWETGELRTGYGGRPEGKRPPGRPKHLWEDNNKVNFQEVVFKGMDWIDLAQDKEM
jgi:hypothetical protein